jgi:hypothetical protein
MSQTISKTLIYRIICKDVTITDSYIGSTVYFEVPNHISNCSSKKTKECIRNNGGLNNWRIIEIEIFQSKDHPDLAKRKRYWIEYYNATLNHIVPSRTEKEYSQQYNQQYREQHKEDIKEYNQQYREQHKEDITCECGSIYKNYKLSRHLKTKKHQLYLLNETPAFLHTTIK